MITTALTLLLCAAIAPEPETFAEVNDLPAPATAPCDEEIRYQQLAAIEESRQSAASHEVEQPYQKWYGYGFTVDYSATYDALQVDDGVTAAEFQWLGVVSDESHTYTWYSERVLPGGGLDDLNANGRHSEGGFVKDGDGYIAVASCDYEKGTVIDTPFGQAKVYDTGYLAPGQVDVYTSF